MDENTDISANDNTEQSFLSKIWIWLNTPFEHIAAAQNFERECHEAFREQHPYWVAVGDVFRHASPELNLLETPLQIFLNIGSNSVGNTRRQATCSDQN